MNSHFTSFTPEAMRALGQDLADGAQRRTELLNNARNQTLTMLAGFQKERGKRTLIDADARRLAVSELKSGVHSLVARFQLNRKEMAADLHQMATELHAASDAFRHRPRPHGASPRRAAGAQPAKQTTPGASAQPFRAAAETHDGPKATSGASAQPFRAAAETHDGPMPRHGFEDKPGDSKKRHG